jgi:hypothetical protein
MRQQAGLAILVILLGVAIRALRERLRDRKRRRHAARVGMKIDLVRPSPD